VPRSIEGSVSVRGAGLVDPGDGLAAAASRRAQSWNVGQTANADERQ